MYSRLFVTGVSVGLAVVPSIFKQAKKQPKTVEEMAGKGDPTGLVQPRKSEKSQPLIINDPVHGLMEFDAVCVAIIDTPQFQRLRFLKQLGVGYYVYPGASHNRFEHCLGVCHLAGKYVEELKDQKITDSEAKCVKVAALCHDLGHGPWSHVFDNHFIRTVRPDTQWKHEDASESLFNYMWKNNEEIRKYISAEEKSIIMAMIRGHPLKVQKTANPEGEKEENRDFLYEIVANNETKFDVDKWDYFLRDCHYLGMSSSFEYNRIIKFSRVLDGHIAIRDKEAFNMHEMFHTRYVLHRRAYQHKTVQAVQIMLVQALQEAEHFIRIPVYDKDGVQVKKLKISECIDDMTAYTNLTDSLYHDIKKHPAVGDEKEHVLKAQRILDDLEKRRLYKMVCESFPLKPTDNGFKKKEKEITEEINKLIQGEYTDLGLTDEGRFVVTIADFDLGSHENNPLVKLKFFRKEGNKAQILQPEEVSALIANMVFCEKLVRIFLRPEDDGKNKARGEALRKAFNQWESENKGQPTVEVT